MRLSAQARSHNFQASDMVLASFPIICSVVRRRRTVIWVTRQKKNCSSRDCSNQRVARSECTCRLQKRASQTFASRKFNVFIDLFIGHVDLWAWRDNQGKTHLRGPGTLSLQ